LYYCLFFLVCSESRVPPRCCSLGVPLLKVPFPDGAPAPPVLCWPQTFKELSLFLFSSFNPSFQVEKDCKVTTFLYSGNQNFQLFLIKYCSYLLIN